MKIRYTLILFVAFTIFTSCSNIEPSDINDEYGIYKNNDIIIDKGPSYGGRLNLFSLIPETISPLIPKNIYEQRIYSFMYKPMFEFINNNEPSPILVKSYSVSEDGLIWEFVLKDDLYWSDGEKITAHDIEYTIDYIKIKGSSSIYAKNIRNFIMSSAINDNKIKIFLKKINYLTKNELIFPIIKKDSYTSYKLFKEIKKEDIISSGEYILKEINDKNILLTLNNSLKTDNLIKEVNFKLYNDLRLEKEVFFNNEIDFLICNFYDYDKYENRKDIKIIKYPSSEYIFIALNTEKSIFKNKDIRKAIINGIDTNNLLSEDYKNKVVNYSMPVLINNDIYTEKSIYRNFDKKKAKEDLKTLLTEEEMKEKYKILVNNEDKIKVEIANNVGKYLKEAGLNVEIINLEWNLFLHSINKKDFDMVLMSINVGTDNDMSPLFSKPYIENITFSDSSLGNISSYKNKDIEVLFEKYFTESDIKKRKVIFQSISDIIVEDSAYIGLFFKTEAAFYNKRIKGNKEPFTLNPLKGFKNWYLPY